MRFTILRYRKDPIDFEDPGKAIGVLVQEGKEILFRFSKDFERLKKYDPNVDQFVVGSIGKTIKSVVASKSMHVSSPKLESGLETSTGDIEFLENLRRSYQGKIQFSDIREINYPKTRKALRMLYKQYVN